MNLVCIVKVDVKAYYDIVGTKTLDVALKEYTYWGTTKDFYMNEQGTRLNFKKTLEIQFNNMADFIANFEKELLNEISGSVKYVENWTVAYDIKQVRGADVYF